MPNSITTYINERAPKTPHEAAICADEYSLTHKITFTDAVPGEGCFRSGNNAGNDCGRSSGMDRRQKTSVSGTCNYCQRLGHWKNECPALRVKSNYPHGPMKSTALATTMNKGASVLEVEQKPFNDKPGYAAFISVCFFRVQINRLR